MFEDDTYELQHQPKTHAEASFLVTAVATYYPTFTKVFVPSIPYEKMLPGMEPLNKQVTYGVSDIAKTSNEDDIERSLRRTKASIRDYAITNQFELFATFTFKSNRYDNEKSKVKMNNWLKNQKKRKGKFEYLIVPEFHNDKKALHFHALIKGYKGNLEPAINPHTNKPIKDVYQFPSYTLGFNNVKKIDDDPKSSTRVGNYIRKYVTKDMPVFHAQHRYWVSSKLKRPTREDNPEWYHLFTPDTTYITEYGTIYEYYGITEAES